MIAMRLYVVYPILLVWTIHLGKYHCSSYTHGALWTNGFKSLLIWASLQFNPLQSINSIDRDNSCQITEERGLTCHSLMGTDLWRWHINVHKTSKQSMKCDGLPI